MIFLLGFLLGIMVLTSGTIVGVTAVELFDKQEQRHIIREHLNHPPTTLNREYSFYDYKRDLKLLMKNAPQVFKEAKK